MKKITSHPPVPVITVKANGRTLLHVDVVTLLAIEFYRGRTFAVLAPDLDCQLEVDNGTETRCYPFKSPAIDPDEDA